jgi:hypothetical protein
VLAYLILCLFLGFKKNHAYELYAPKAKSSVNLQVLEAEIKTNSIKSISTLLRILAKKYPTYMSNFTVVHRSLSLQNSSYENPRVLIFGEDASFVISFNGSPTQRGYANLEIMRYDSELHEFFFHEITFEEDQLQRIKASKAEELDQLEQEVLQDTAHLHKVTSPQVCLTCHTPYKKPNWDAYPNWPGVYGALDDKTAGHFPDQKMPRNLIYTGGMALAISIPTHDRYQHVPGLQNYIEDVYTQGRFGAGKSTPNLVFTEFLGRLNFDRYFYRLTQLPAYAEYPLAVPASLYGCMDSKENFERVYPGKDYEDFLTIEADTTARIQRNRVLKRDLAIDFEYPSLSHKDKVSFLNYETNYGLITAGPMEKPIANLRYFVESVLRDTMMFDSMSFNPGTYDFLMGSDHLEVARAVYLEQLAYNNPALYDRIISNSKRTNMEICRAILK